MSAAYMRELVRQKVAIQLRGEDGGSGLEASILAGARGGPKSYEVYRDLCALRAGLLQCLEYMDQAYKQIHNPESETVQPEGTAAQPRPEE